MALGETFLDFDESVVTACSKPLKFTDLTLPSVFQCCMENLYVKSIELGG